MKARGALFLGTSMVLLVISLYTCLKSSVLRLPSARVIVFTTVLALTELGYALLSTVHNTSGRVRMSYALVANIRRVQVLVAIVLLTILLQEIGGDGLTKCRMETIWQGMWSKKDFDGIRTIQDQFSCCGFRSLKDRAWPINGRSSCSATYDRDTACYEPWSAAMRWITGIDIAVVVVIAMMQLASLYAQARTDMQRPRTEAPLLEEGRQRQLLTPVQEADEEDADEEGSGSQSNAHRPYTDNPNGQPAPERDEWVREE